MVTPTSPYMGVSIQSKHTIVALVIRGTIEFESNLEKLKAEAGCRILFPNLAMLSTQRMSDDFKALVLSADETFTLDSAIGIASEEVHSVFTNSVRRVTDKTEWKMLTSFVSSIKASQDYPSTVKMIQLCKAIFHNVLLLLCEVEIPQIKKANRNVSITASYFRRFIHLLNNHVRREHEVNFYAAKLGISPKYLGEICKIKSGRKAKEIISAVLVANIKHDLAISGKTMKNLACDYNFSDQSSMGKFFRKLTGVSPLTYKRQASGVESVEFNPKELVKEES